jgi:hypothetical protein
MNILNTYRVTARDPWIRRPPANLDCRADHSDAARESALRFPGSALVII